MDRGKCHFPPSYSYTSSSCTVDLLLHLQYYQRCEAIIFKMCVFLFLRKPYFYKIFTKRSNKTYVFKGLCILITHCYCKSEEIYFWYHRKQPSRGVHKKWCSCCKFTEEHPCQSAISVKLLCNFIEIALWHGCSPVNLLHIFRTPSLKNTSGRLLLCHLQIAFFLWILHGYIQFSLHKK